MAVTPQAPLFAALERGTTVLTPTRRAARALSRAFDRQQRELGKTRWQPANVLPLESWLGRLWHELLVAGHETRLLLNPTQEQAVWRAIIAARPESGGSAALAGLAAEAWKLLNLHQGKPRLAQCGVSTDGKAFVGWAREFQARCQRQAYLAAAELPQALEAAVAAGTLDLPDNGLQLVDFGALPPAHTSLFAAIERAGYMVRHFATATPAASRSLCRCNDVADELRACALWLRDQLQQDPTRQLAVVVPDLAQRREAIARAFHAELASGEAEPIFEFSLGYPLAQTAFAAAALDLLRWPFAPLSLAQISQLLISPGFVSSPDETQAAAEFDAFELRHLQTLRPELTLDAMIALLRDSKRRDRLPNLFARLRQLRSGVQIAAPTREMRLSHAGWAGLFRELVQAAMPAPEPELLRTWESVLDELATLDFEGMRTTGIAALDALSEIAHKTSFAPPSNAAPIQILGPLEVGAVGCDGLWFLGADDFAWPPPAPAHPFLAWALARDLGIPGADRGRDLLVAETLTRRIAGAASEVVFSFAEESDDGERRPSPLLTLLQLVDRQPPSVAQAVALPLLHSFDTTAVPTLSSQPLSGGARLFELQAACSFRAFAELRLFSTSLDTRAPGLDARDRGVLVHTVMQRFWQQVKEQSTLKALSIAARDAMLDECIDFALTRAQARADTSWDHAYVHTQRQRLGHLLRPWLDFEAERPDFAVFDQETSVNEVEIGALKLKSLRVDRIDITAAGPLILDYKTGRADPAAWRTARPEQPQLPLYAALAAERVGLDEPLAGVAFALLRAGDGLALKGFADDRRVLDKPSPMDEVSFADQIAAWRAILVQLANDFAAGEARVAPRAYPKTCAVCDQRILCRLDPTTLAADDEPDPMEEEVYV